MNKLSELIMKESLKSNQMGMMDSLEYLCTGSIIANSNVKDRKEFYELHGSIPAQLYVLVRCVEELAKHANVPVAEILDFMKKTSEEVCDVD